MEDFINEYRIIDIYSVETSQGIWMDEIRTQYTFYVPLVGLNPSIRFSVGSSYIIPNRSEDKFMVKDRKKLFGMAKEYLSKDMLYGWTIDKDRLLKRLTFRKTIKNK